MTDDPMGRATTATDGSGRGVHAAAIADLPGCGPVCQAKLLARFPAPIVWSQLIGGGVGGIGSSEDRRRWQHHARSCDLDRLHAELQRNDAVATTIHDADHPPPLVDDIDPAPVVFRGGAPFDPSRPTVAIVGTRRCTPTGRELAAELGRELTRAGVVVVSGLALGIDGAAHRGALRESDAAPVAVVGSGLDIVYPRGNADLWRRIAACGTILSEVPLGRGPEPWRFPARNRIIAALADVVVVVESKAAGGSMITVEEAIRRGRPVLAVPGSVRNPAAAGTNLLISEGCAPACAVDDVLVALDLATAGTGSRLLTDDGRPGPPPAEIGDLSPVERLVVSSVDFGGISLDELSERCEAAVEKVAATVVTLQQRGLVTLVDGLVRRRLTPTATSGGVTNAGGGPIASNRDRLGTGVMARRPHPGGGVDAGCV